MEKCLTIREGVERVLKIFEKEPVDWELIPGEYTDTLVLEGVRYPLFWWRADPQVDMMQELAPERKICSMKLNLAEASDMTPSRKGFAPERT